MADGDDVDPCGEIDFGDPLHLTLTDEEQTAVVLFGDVDWTDPAQVEARRAEWEALA